MTEPPAPRTRGRWGSKGATEVDVGENKIAPDGMLGRHSLAGPSIVVIKTGELTLYHSDDLTCTPNPRPGALN